MAVIQGDVRRYAGKRNRNTMTVIQGDVRRYAAKRSGRARDRRGPVVICPLSMACQEHDCTGKTKTNKNRKQINHLVYNSCLNNLLRLHNQRR